MFSDQSGKVSMMRIGFFMCLCIGSILSLSGIIAVFMSLSDASTLIATGTALMGTSGFAKAVQARWEQK